MTMASGDGNDAAYREPIGRKQWERELADTRIARRRLDRLAAEDRSRNLLDKQADEIAGDLHEGVNLLDRVTFVRVVRWLLLDRDAEADAALRAGRLVLGPVTIERVRP